MSQYQVQGVAFDPWNASQLGQRMADEGADMIEFGQTYSNMNAPTQELEALVAAGRITHGGHPVLAWMARNVIVRRDGGGHLRPDKTRSQEKIDGIVALIMALGLYQKTHSSADDSWLERGIAIL